MMRSLSILFAMLAACTPKSSLQRHNYPSDSPRFEYEMHDVVPYGTGRVWLQNVTLKYECQYVNGVKHGRFTYYDEDGKFSHQVFFYKDVEVWRYTVEREEPPAELEQGLVKFSGSEPRIGERRGDESPEE